MSPTVLDPVIEVHLDPHELRLRLIEDAVAGLTSVPKDLPPKWFYDERGSKLFDEITRLPEYYPTEAERAILRANADEIARVTGADTLVELGSGTSDKTAVLLNALRRADQLERYVPFDVSEPTLRTAADRLAQLYPGLAICGVVGDFDHHLDRIPTGGRRLFAFLGGTIGNYELGPRRELLAAIGAVMEIGDHFLLGTDLVKEPARLVAAYDDVAGVTAEFNRNVLRVLNSELDADFEPERFAHVARWDPYEEWIEMRLRSLTDQTVHLAHLDLDVNFVEGEEMRTEVSAKFRRERVADDLAAGALRLTDWYTDRAGDFAVSLSSH